jgi:hypothetical protein
MLSGKLIGTVGELSFYAFLNSDGGIDLPLSPDGTRDLTIGYEHHSTGIAGNILCRYESDAVPDICWNVAGFFDANKEVLCEKALFAVHSN